MIKKAVDLGYRMARRIAVAVVGSTVLIAGVIMLVAPGPAILVIPVGLAILGIEFAWARYWLKHVRAKISGANAQNFATRAERHRDQLSH